MIEPRGKASHSARLRRWTSPGHQRTRGPSESGRESAIADEVAPASGSVEPVSPTTELAAADSRTFRPNGRSDGGCANSELGIVHLTLTDLRTGVEHFDQLLYPTACRFWTSQSSREHPLRQGPLIAFARINPKLPPTPPRSSPFSSRSSPPVAGGFGGSRGGSVAPPASAENEPEPEMVFVEAPPAANRKDSGFLQPRHRGHQRVSIDPSASGTNVAPAEQKLRDYSQYERGAHVIQV